MIGLFGRGAPRELLRCINLKRSSGTPPRAAVNVHSADRFPSTWKKNAPNLSTARQRLGAARQIPTSSFTKRPHACATFSARRPSRVLRTNHRKPVPTRARAGIHATRTAPVGTPNAPTADSSRARPRPAPMVAPNWTRLLRARDAPRRPSLRRQHFPPRAKSYALCIQFDPTPSGACAPAAPGFVTSPAAAFGANLAASPTPGASRPISACGGPTPGPDRQPHRRPQAGHLNDART